MLSRTAPQFQCFSKTIYSRQVDILTKHERIFTTLLGCELDFKAAGITDIPIRNWVLLSRETDSDENVMESLARNRHDESLGFSLEAAECHDPAHRGVSAVVADSPDWLSGSELSSLPLTAYDGQYVASVCRTINIRK